jgi:glycosyltransferase involved in cell wall biosynthesis
MSQKLPISVFIIAKNEEERISFAINSVINWVEEVIVIDSGSSDNTVELSKKLGAIVEYNEWRGYGQQKIFGESLCKNDWILNIDADEEISTELKDNIFKIFEKGLTNIDEAGFEIKWKMIFLHQQKPPLFATGGQVLRLYNKRFAGFRDSTIHDSVILKDGFKDKKIGFIKGNINHRCFKSLKHWIDKVNFYTTAQAKEWVEKGRKPPSLLRIMFEPSFSFLKSYIFRRYIFYGIDGINASFIYSFSKTLRLAKVREILINKKSDIRNKH